MRTVRQRIRKSYLRDEMPPACSFGLPFTSSVLASRRCGGRYMPPLAIVDAMVTSCTGRHRDLLSHWNGADSRRLPAMHRLQQSARLARQLDPAAIAKAKGANVLVERLRPHALREPDRAHVA